ELPIAFAATPLYALSDRLQLKNLSTLLGTPQVRRGNERPAPNWFQPPLGGIERAFKSGLSDAFGAVLQARFRLPPFTVRAAQARLGALTGIVFTESLHCEYTLLGSSVSVSGESWLDEN